MAFIENVFVDTSAWIALADKNDTHHKKAVQLYYTFLKTSKSLVTSNLVIAETYILLLKELGHKAALSFLESVKTSPRILRVFSNENIETEAEKILKKYIDQDFSYTDAVSFALMNNMGIKKAFSFDKHFITAGFQ